MFKEDFKNSFKEGALTQYDNLVGISEKMQRVYKFIQEVAPQQITVLISGETGTGKELVAKAIHNNSKRKDRPFIAINCAAIPEAILESELFGHEKGSFTGAFFTKKGKFELAHGGTLFLDEIGEMNMYMQAKLLRVIENNEINRIGSDKFIKCDVRIIAATNKDLYSEVLKGNFRKDLYYRINVDQIHLPPLRERREDISYLANYFLKEFSLKCNEEMKDLSPEALFILRKYPWPGNVRELRNVLERILCHTTDKKILPEHLPNYLLEKDGKNNFLTNLKKVIKEISLEEMPNNFLKVLKINLSAEILKKNNGNIKKTAEVLGISRNTLKSWLKEYNQNPQI